MFIFLHVLDFIIDISISNESLQTKSFKTHIYS
jgi:hypothetical protein